MAFMTALLMTFQSFKVKHLNVLFFIYCISLVKKV